MEKTDTDTEKMDTTDNHEFSKESGQETVTLSADTQNPQSASNAASTSSEPQPTSVSQSPGVREKSGVTNTSNKKEPLCIIVLGMAGSGKTTFVKRLDSHLNIRKPHHVINLDPAVEKVPYISYIDIRDTVNYKEVMKQYGLGPNGGIVTSLNLFSTMFDDVLKLISKKEEELDYVIFDTPGQIEVFNWSASGPIIAGALAATYPTVIVYVLDAVRSTNPQTFMSNMLYACSILYKYKLPFIIAMNKIDIVDWKYAMDWLQDFDEFQDALANESTYASNLTRSLSLALEEFYSTIKACGVSSYTGEGMNKFEQLLNEGRVEYEEYRAEHRALRQQKQKEEDERKSRDLRQVEQDLKKDGLCSVRKAIRDDTEIYLTHAEGDGDGGEEEELDDDDTEEKKELESFQDFLKSHKTKQEQQRQKTTS